MTTRLTSTTAAWIAFALAAAASVALIGLEARGTTLRGDEFGYAFQLASEPLLEAVLDSRPGKYLLALPMLIYAAMFELFGLDSYLPYRLAGLGLLVLAAGLFFILSRRRVGPLPALAATLPLLFLGSASEVVVIPLRLPSQVAICAGLGAMLLLDREDRRGDGGACALGTVAITSHPVGLAFVVAAAVRVLLRPALSRGRSVWVFAVPLAAYGAWWLTLRDLAQRQLPLTIGDAIGFGAESLAAFCGAVTGLFREPWVGGFDLINPLTIVVAIGFALAVAIALALRLRRPSRADAALWAALAALVVVLVAPALAPGGARVPQAPRYLYPGAIALLWVLVEIARGVRLRGDLAIGAWVVVAALLVSGLYANVETLRQRAGAYAAQSDILKAQLGGLEIIRGQIEDAVAGRDDVAVPAPKALARDTDQAPTEAEVALAIYSAVDDVYFAVADAYGSPAYTPEQIAGRPLRVRRQVDATLAGQLKPRLEPRAQAATDERPVEIERVLAAESQIRGGCVELRPAAEGTPPAGRVLPAPPETSGAPALAEVILPAAGAGIDAGSAGRFGVRLGRFADSPGYPVPGGRGHAVALSLPRDGARRHPWRFVVYSSSPLSICTL